MRDLVFVTTSNPLPLATLAVLAGATVPEGASPDRSIIGAAALDRAGSADVTMFQPGADRTDLQATRAGVCLVAEADLVAVPVGTIALVTRQPLEAFRRIMIRLYPDGVMPVSSRRRSAIDPSAIVHSDASLEAGVLLDAGVVVGPGVEIGSGTRIGVNSVIGDGVRIGRNCAIDSHVSVRAALIGDRVVLHTGARIGVGGPIGSKASALPRLGRVIVQDGAEIGANAAIERGALADTVIGEGSRIGALVVVSSETMLDRHTLIEGSPFPRR